MNLASLQIDAVRYNLWANNRLVEWAKAQPPESLNQTVLSSFPSAWQTLVHIWETETFWFNTLRNLPNERGWNQPYEGTAEALFADVTNRSTELVDYVQSLSEAELQAVGHYFFPWIGEITRHKFELIHHCLTHSNYHRGQLVTIGHQLGWFSPPNTDYFIYLTQK